MKKTMLVEEMIAEWLEQNGYDGLYDPDYGECSCLLEDLCPCCDPESVWGCMPGYRSECDCGNDEHDWHVGPRKVVRHDRP